MPGTIIRASGAGLGTFWRRSCDTLSFNRELHRAPISALPRNYIKAPLAPGSPIEVETSGVLDGCGTNMSQMAGWWLSLLLSNGVLKAHDRDFHATYFRSTTESQLSHLESSGVEHSAVFSRLPLAETARKHDMDIAGARGSSSSTENDPLSPTSCESGGSRHII